MSGEGNGTAIPDGQYEAPFQYYLNNQVLDQSTNFSNSIPTFTNNELVSRLNFPDQWPQ